MENVNNFYSDNFLKREVARNAILRQANEPQQSLRISVLSRRQHLSNWFFWKVKFSTTRNKRRSVDYPYHLTPKSKTGLFSSFQSHRVVWDANHDKCVRVIRFSGKLVILYNMAEDISFNLRPILFSFGPLR